MAASLCDPEQIISFCVTLFSHRTGLVSLDVRD